MTIETINAKITSTQLGVEDHGIMTAFLFLDYGDRTQCFGGYCLGTPEKPDVSLAKFITRVIEVVGVCNWEDLPGKVIRVKQEHTKVHQIGHFLKEEWYDPSEELK